MRNLLQPQDLSIGQRYFFAPPPHKSPAQGLAPRMGAPDTDWPAQGREAEFTDYVFGCLRRGSLLAFESDAMVAEREKAEQAAQPTAPPDPTGGPIPDATEEPR